MGERLLVLRLKRGDARACIELIRRHHQGVYGYLRRLGADAALAEDLTQETYAKAWTRIGMLKDAASLRSWLLTIARNEFFQWVRAERRMVAEPPVLLERRDESPVADEMMMLAERDRDLRRAIARLDPPLQEAVALHYFQDLSLREVGDVLGLPSGTVKSRINRALGCLRSLLDGKEVGHEERSAQTTPASNL